MPNKKLYSVILSSPELDTLNKYVSADSSPAINYSNNLYQFLSVIGEDGISNAQRITDSYTTSGEKDILVAKGIISISQDKKKITILKPGDLPLKAGTIFYLEYEKVNSISFLVEGLEVVSTDEVAFKAAQLAKLEADKGYVSVNKVLPNSFQTGVSKEIYPDCTVWLWCRSISSNNDMESELQGEIFDLTPFIQKITTNVDRNGGNFQITLPPLVCELSEFEKKWILKKKQVVQSEKEYVAEASMFELDSDNKNESMRRNQFLFNNIISPNDLIFIRFETLHLDKQQRYFDSKEFHIYKSKLAGRIYDMIGLVDSKTLTTNPSSNDVSINISGRDLSKLFIEDGTYFYALENSQGVVKVAGNTSLKNTVLSRAFGEKGMQFIGLYNFTSIQHILMYIIQQLANIKIVPNELFSSYNDGVTDRRNKRFNEIQYTPVTNTNNSHTPEFKEEVSNGIWQIVKLVIDESVTQRRLADTSFSTAQGSLLNFIRSACQEPLVQFYMDTYGDQFHLIVRKPPYDQKALISLIEGKVSTEEGTADTPPIIIDIEEEDVVQESLKMDDTQVYSWYHFFPKGAMINDSVDYSTAIIPAIFFDEYAQVFGSKPFQQSHAYVPYVPMSFYSNEFGNLLYEQAFSDMKYVIESNQMLPFTRKGAITLNGDRRLKIGNIIRYKPTGEIFFIDSVQQNIQISDSNIDRTTTIQVSRGMIESLIYGIHLAPQDGNGKRMFVSYFNLIDTRLNKTEVDKKKTITELKNFGKKQVEKTIQTGTDHGADELLQPTMVKGQSHLDRFTNQANKRLFIQFINQITASGYEVIITDAVRTYEEQAARYKDNKKNADPAKKTSTHQLETAIDINVRNVQTGKQVYKSSSEVDWRATGVPGIANSLGINWAGNNDGTFGTKGTGSYYIDRVHYQISNDNLSTETVLVDDIRPVTRDTVVKGFDESRVFENFKVNRFTFNFFLKNLQFDPKFKQGISRTVYNSDQEGTNLDGSKFDAGGEKTLNNVIITSKRKK